MNTYIIIYCMSIAPIYQNIPIYIYINKEYFYNIFILMPIKKYLFTY